MPHLRVLSLKGTPFKTFSLDAPWLGQLRRLTLSDLHGFDATEVPYALARLPLLEHLVLELALPRDAWELVEPILPRLRSLYITDSFSAAAYLLRYIAPSDGYSLSMDLQVSNLIMPSQETRYFCDAIKRYINNSFRCGSTSESLLFVPGPRSFIFKGSKAQITFPVSKFLEDRNRIGNPITMLDITALSNHASENLDSGFDGVVPDWTHLDYEFPGLWVGYSMSGYKCGTGAPEKLGLLGRNLKPESTPDIASSTVHGPSTTKILFEDLMYYY
ncbi:hypothetical protein JR316_0012343 [Psilocybe cubensis]|uniref:Uncharacterized protein n=1 Tax=Psilocybe cubensis TaxID=181762 RepID=A0ACB8GIK7_PSICU|nr:hypothetical protein JR316_0012343 [Psilocybe cubensis]KAH9475232.1 hypothetical protein JR316_0012343 [Psilocybe cubensis]